MNLSNAKIGDQLWVTGSGGRRFSQIRLVTAVNKRFVTDSAGKEWNINNGACKGASGETWYRGPYAELVTEKNADDAHRATQLWRVLEMLSYVSGWVDHARRANTLNEDAANAIGMAHDAMKKAGLPK
jgi:hypothetical protein